MCYDGIDPETDAYLEGKGFIENDKWDEIMSMLRVIKMFLWFFIPLIAFLLICLHGCTCVEVKKPYKPMPPLLKYDIYGYDTVPYKDYKGPVIYDAHTKN